MIKARPNRLVTIGTGSGYAVLGRGGASHLVEVGRSCFLLDCGEGTAGWLNQLELSSSIKYIFLSHLHSDHVSGLFVLLQNMLLDDRKEPLEIYLPEEGVAIFSEMMKVVYLSPPRVLHDMFQVTFKPLKSGGIVTDGKFNIKAWKTDHFRTDIERGIKPERECFGFTIDASDCRLVYTADVSSVDCFRSELQLNTTLLCEAMHIDVEEVVKISKAEDIDKVIFVHSDPDKISELQDYCYKCVLTHAAHDGMEFTW